jgi:eukaryotic-like serine/threonine-protein kinase
MANHTGQQLGNYRLSSLLGAGGFARVYLGEHIHLGTMAAIKVLDRRLTDEEVERFRNEARTILHLEHPNIVRVLDFGIEDLTPYLIMNYAPNGSLYDICHNDIPLPLERILPYVRQAASALNYAHDNRVIHRDVKPQNMLLGNQNEVLLSDFGIAVLAHTEGSLTTQEMAGTAQYMAPEQIRGKPRPASDQYALGIVVYEWLCGVLPFRGSRWEIIEQQISAAPSPLRDMVPYLPIAVEEVVLKALAKDPQERFPSVQAFAAALEQASQGMDQLHVVSPENLSDSPLLTGTPLAPANTGGSATRSSLPPHPLPQPEFAEPTNPGAESEPEQTSYSQPDSPGPSEMIVDTVQPPITQPTTSPSLPPARPSARPYRRKVTFLVGVVLLLVLIIGGVVLYMLKNLPANYAMFGFDAQHTRFNPQEHTINPSNVSQLLPYWTFSTNGRIAASPAVVDGVVYVASLDGYLYAIDANTGSQRWSIAIQTGSYLESSPAVVNGVVYIGSSDYKLYAIDASTGKILWFATTQNVLTSSPTFANGVVYVGSGDTRLYAFNASGCGHPSCAPLWTAPTSDGIDSSPAVADGVIYVSSQDGTLAAFNASTGALLWSAAPTKKILYITSSPTVANNIVYVGSEDGKLYAFNASGCGHSSCSPLWATSAGGAIESSPAVANGVVYVSSFDGKLYAFDVSNGTPLWTASLGQGGGGKSSATVANGLVYIGSEDHHVYAFNASGCGHPSCSPLWSFTTGAEVESSPVIANGVAYVGSLDGKLYSFHLP